MTDFVINNHILNTECENIAKEALQEARDANPDGDIDVWREDADTFIHESVDGHGWVIYTYKALRLCVECDVSDGECFLEETGLPETVTLSSLATTIAYGEMRARAMAALEEQLEALEDELEGAET